jgi:hypothetical protein
VQANDSDARAQHTRKVLENVRYVPLAIMHGTDDELVPYSGVARQAQRLQELGYRYRFYTYPGYEHYSHPIMDQWAEQARYMHQFTAPVDPREVTYKRDMPMERATETVQSSGISLDFSFDSAYWMSHLQATDDQNGTASFDGFSWAIPEDPWQPVPEAAPPASAGSTGPFVMAGQQWIVRPNAETQIANHFYAVVKGARNVQLDLTRMRIETTEAITALVDTGDALDLRLEGDWTTAPVITVDGQPASAQLLDGVLSIPLAPGIHDIAITPDVQIGPAPLI